MNKTHLIGNITATFFILIWFAFGFYVGISGIIYEENKKLNRLKEQVISNEKVEYHGIVFNSKERLDTYIEEIKIINYFSWITKVPELIILVFSSCAFGAFGGLIRIIRQISFEGLKLHETHFIAIPFLGMLLGIAVLGISYLLPTILIAEGDIQIRQTSLMFFSLFTGLFSKRFLNWLEDLFKKYLKEKAKTQIK